MSKPIITVFGATGNQGGSVISTILSLPTLSSKYSIRAITRDTTKPAAQDLSSKGAECVKADLNDPSSISSAVSGSHAVFAVTNYWEKMDPDLELTQGRNIVDACKAAGVKHLVWSALPYATKLTDGELKKIEHFDSKAQVQEYAESFKGDMTVSYFRPGYFMSNVPGQIKPVEGEAGTYAISLPWNATKTWVPMISIRHDVGPFVAGLIEAGSSANGVVVNGTSQWMHPDEIVETISKVTGKKVVWKETDVTIEMTDKMDRVPAELAQNMLLVRDYSYFGKGEETKQGDSDKYFVKGVEKQTWKNFCEAYKWEL